MSSFIPNAFQVPNAYIDEIWHLLTPQEQSVLIYMARRIFGFGKRQDRISISQFTTGTRALKDGRALDGGTGLGADAVRRALTGLIEFGLACEEAPATHESGPLYSLQLDSDGVNRDGLEERKSAKAEAARERTKKARQKVEGSVGQRAGGLSHRGVGVCGTETQYTGEKQGKDSSSVNSKNLLRYEDSSYREEADFSDELFD